MTLGRRKSAPARGTQMPAITFKAKAETIYNMDETVAYHRVKVPAIKRNHCDMNGFRQHPKYRAYANSDLFASLIKRALASAQIGEYIRLDRIPACVAVDASEFLHSITIDI